MKKNIEPKSDESRLLTCKQMAECSHNPVQELREVAICQAQRDLTASIKDNECQQKLKELVAFVNHFAGIKHNPEWKDKVRELQATWK